MQPPFLCSADTSVVSTISSVQFYKPSYVAPIISHSILMKLHISTAELQQTLTVIESRQSNALRVLLPDSANAIPYDDKRGQTKPHPAK